MVAAIYFLREMLVYTFTKLLVRVQSRSLLAFLFVATGAILSVFLDAFTVLAVIITVAGGFYAVYHRVASGKSDQEEVHDASTDGQIGDLHRSDLDAFGAQCRSSSMICRSRITTIGGFGDAGGGEPDSSAEASGLGNRSTSPARWWSVITAGNRPTGRRRRAQRFAWFGYGSPVPPAVRQVLLDFERRESARMTPRHKHVIVSVQVIVAILLVIALAFHVAEIGVIGLAIIGARDRIHRRRGGRSPWEGF